MSELKPRTVLANAEGQRYRIVREIGAGGFGRVYLAHRLFGAEDQQAVAVKVCSTPRDWHGEAFYGELLARERGVVRVLDSFAHPVGKSRIGYVLVSELMSEGTVADRVEDSDGPLWSESRVRSRISALLILLAKMHEAGITHRDIKPSNVYVRNGALVLGDFGISKMTLGVQRSEVDAWTPAFSPRDVGDGFLWGPAVDVFQVGLLTATLLTGTVWQTDDLAGLRHSQIADDLMCWIWHTTSPKARRYQSAREAAHALNTLGRDTMAPGRFPSRLANQHVVLTGRIDGMTRKDAIGGLMRAGARVQETVTNETSLLIRGTVRNVLGETEGRKLFAVRERRRTGQKIHIVSGGQLVRALS
ncbi:protein kinase [Rhodococcus sp. BP-349]|nr:MULTISPECIES: protein kinase [unclassified Rhodococcus (in: high G+C Gram-positive bacteria)]MBY6543626.1 protein kinase [Rhodococcus sp. BP-369]MBY6562856.1 protein kinase [Rhodococcus sp. BP-370]MBY6577148.1 protein kinase [Rhodococcus sp. BP-364]MBY6586449.1 protein kinase [Rhodococcus sp. BP-358]MBY6590786.1 protein kinase [Rhodococcus sp. BP-362]MBY6625487.1 protein kinase [Rhodococcus sp. BP-350]MBY6634161.1 protein kinase [Rhodococcus sp. BP-343]MBY6651511.1 protein kinase [Rhodoc